MQQIIRNQKVIMSSPSYSTDTYTHNITLKCVSSYPLLLVIQEGARSRDDLDLEQTLKSPGNHSPPDVIRSALNKDGDPDGSEDNACENVVSPSSASIRMIDNLFGVPDKIVIPERYIPDTVSKKICIC